MTERKEFTPYPRRPGDATADSIVRHLSVEGLIHAVRSLRLMREADATENTPQHQAAVTRHLMNINIFTAEYAAVRALKALKEVDPQLADGVAREIWETWEAGPEVGEFLWDWVEGYGIDPDAVEAESLARLDASMKATV
jgi:hypothetical protein